jgi:hypothetical protein
MNVGLNCDRSSFLPNSEDTLLYQAVLLTGDIPRAAWREWIARVGSFTDALRGSHRLTIKRLLPLLQVSQKRNDLAIDTGVLRILRAAYLGEATRASYCRRIGRDVIGKFADGQLSPVVLRGFAFSETIYDEPPLRHCHDIDLLIAAGLEIAATATLNQLGFSANGNRPPGDGVRLIHRSGFPVVLHASILTREIDALLADEMKARCETGTVAGLMARVLAPCDAFLSTLGHAWTNQNCRSPMWICDLRLLADRLSITDWAIARDSAQRAGLTLPFCAALDYLQSQLEARLPSSIREQTKTQH